MFPPIFEVCRESSDVNSIFGDSPMRVYPFGFAPQTKVYPYAVWQTVSGSPENFLGDRPDADAYTVQVDVYGKTASSVREAVKVLRDALEPVAYIASWRSETKDAETGNYRFGFDLDWIVQR